jgi:molybdenum cofactor guanylyltransferase
MAQLESPLSGIGGIVLCGGHSRRMGQPKHSLPFGSEVLLQRVCRIVGEVVSPVLVVAAENQRLPPLPAQVVIVRDAWPDAGPLAGIATGLHRLRSTCRAAFVTACDAPLLNRAFISRLIELFLSQQATSRCESAVPTDAEFIYCLSAIYSVELADAADELLINNKRRPLLLTDSPHCRKVSTDDFLDVDPELHSLRSMNTIDEYHAALKIADFHT